MTVDYRANVNSSDGPSCFWLVEYQVRPLIETTAGPDEDERLHQRVVNVLADHQPTIGEAYTVIPADEQERVTRVQVRPMHPNALGNAFQRGHAFTDLHSGHIGPLEIQVRHRTSIEAHTAAIREAAHA